MVARVVLLQLASLSCVLALPAIGAFLEDVNTAVLVRGKRDPSRSLTFSGFMPSSGMSAFASSADFTPYYRPRRPAHQPRGWSPEEGRGEYPPEPATVEHPPEPATVEHPPEREGKGKPWAQPEEKEPEEKEPEEEQEEEPAEAPVARPTKKNKKKYTPKETDEDEEEYEKPSRGGGNAAASFNAWFPIMLGMFPPSGYPGQGVEGRESQGARYPQTGHTTVIANSVSHGRSGVASSHAVAYGGGSIPPQSPPHRR